MNSDLCFKLIFFLLLIFLSTQLVHRDLYSTGRLAVENCSSAVISPLKILKGIEAEEFNGRFFRAEKHYC